MSYDFVIKQNDTWPPLGSPTPVTLSDTAGPINLTGASVKFMARLASDENSTPIVGNCTIVGAATNGQVRYDWIPTNTAVAGEYIFEFQITFSDGKVATVPTEGYKSLLISDDIAQ